MITNTVFNYLSGVTSDIQTQINSINTNVGDKQNLFLNNISSTLTSNVANYNYDFRRSDTNGQKF